MVIHIMMWQIVDQLLVCSTLWTKHQLIGISRNKLIFKWQHLDQSLLLQEPVSNRQWTCELLSIIQELLFAKIATCLETTKVLLIVLQSQMQRQTNTTTCCLFITPEKALHRIMHASVISIEMPIWLTSCQSILHVTRPSQCHVHHCFMVVMLWIHWDQNGVGICLGYCVLQLRNWLWICVLCFRIVLRNKHTYLHQISHLNKDTCNIIVEWGVTENEQFQLSHFVCCSSLHWHVSMSRSHNEMSHDDMSIIHFVQPGRQQEREIVL